MKQCCKGFTLIEVLIFITLIPLIFIAVSYITTYSLQNTKINQNKILATHYAEELKEWLRGEKEEDWNTFATVANMGNWCFNNEPITDWDSHSRCGSSYGLNNLYKRDLTLTKDSDTQATAKITVEWKENNNTYKIPINTVFSLWE
jgi:type II secretory pathway pseudopilin PulG